MVELGSRWGEGQFGLDRSQDLERKKKHILCNFIIETLPKLFRFEWERAWLDINQSDHLVLVWKLVLPGRTLAPAIPHLMLLPIRGQNATKEKLVKEDRSNLRYVESPAPRLCRIGVGFNTRERGDQVVQVLLGHPLELLSNRMLVTSLLPGFINYCCNCVTQINMLGDCKEVDTHNTVLVRKCSARWWSWRGSGQAPCSCCCWTCSSLRLAQGCCLLLQSPETQYQKNS